MAEQKIYQFNLPEDWGSTSLQYQRELNITEIDSDPQEIRFYASGEKALLLGADGDNVYELSLTTAWKIDTAVLNHTFDISDETTTPTGLAVKSDDKGFYVCDSDGYVYQYGMTDKADLSSASLTKSVDFSSTIATAYAVFFSPDGKLMQLSGESNAYEFELTTAWDIDTAYRQKYTLTESDCSAMCFGKDGEKLYAISTGTEKVYEYDLDSSYKIASASDSGNTLDFSGDPPDLTAGDIHSININPDGDELILFDSGKAVHYSLSTDWDVSSGSLDYTEDFSDFSEDIKAVDFDAGGENFFVISDNTIFSMHLTERWDVRTRKETGSQEYLKELTGSVSTPYSLHIFPHYAYILWDKDTLASYYMEEEYDVNNLFSWQDTNNIAGNSESIRVQDTGKRFFLAVDDTIYEYTCGSDWLIDDIYHNPELVYNGDDLRGMDFSPDGSLLFAIDNTNSSVEKYDNSLKGTIKESEYKRLYDTSEYDSDYVGLAVYPGDSAYEITNPFGDGALDLLKWAQVNNTLFFAHPNFKPRRLDRTSHNQWAFSEMEFDYGPFLTQNTNEDWEVKATDNGDETANLEVQGAPSDKETFTEDNIGGLFLLKHERTDNQINGTFSGTDTSDTVVGRGEWKVTTHGTWTGTLELQRSLDGGTSWHTYRVYSSSDDNNAIDTGIQEEEDAVFRLKMTSYTSGDCKYVFVLYEYYHESIFRITSVSDKDTATADIVRPSSGELDADDVDGSWTSIWREGAWSDRRGFPRAIAFHQQRLVFGATEYEPDKIWGSAIDDYTNFELGTNDNEAYQYQIASQQRENIKWLLSERFLLAGAGGGIWGMGGGANLEEPLTPNNVHVRKITTQGSNNVVPFAERAFFTNRRSDNISELSYDAGAYKYVPKDVSILAPHITEDGVREMAWSDTPYNTLWAVTETDKLISLIREADHEITGWANYEIGNADKVEHIAVVPGEYGDEVWLSIRRTINGEDVRYLELFQPEHWDKHANAVHLDCSLEYHGDPATEFSEADHFEGETITVLADGKQIDDVEVSDGKFTLDEEASDVIAGYLYKSKVTSMPVLFKPDQTGRIPELYFELINSVGGKAYINELSDKMQSLKSGETLFDGIVNISVPSVLDNRLEVTVQNETAHPFTLLALHMGHIVWSKGQSE